MPARACLLLILQTLESRPELLWRQVGGERGCTVGTYLSSLSILASSSPLVPPTLQEELAPAAAVNSWQGQWLIQMNLVGRRLSFQKQPTWNNLEGPPSEESISWLHGRKEEGGGGMGGVTAAQEAPAELLVGSLAHQTCRALCLRVSSPVKSPGQHN